MIEGLPKGLSDQVIGYAESVERALPEIFRDAGRQYNSTIADQLVFLAGVRKLHSIVVSSYWILDNSAALLKELSTDQIRVGHTDYSRGGVFYQDLAGLLDLLEKVLIKHNISQYLNVPFSEVLKMLVTDGRH